VADITRKTRARYHAAIWKVRRSEADIVSSCFATLLQQSGHTDGQSLLCCLLPPPFLVLDSMGLEVIFLVGQSSLLLSEISPFVGIICVWNVVGRRRALWLIL